MRNLKKVLALVIAFSMMLSVVAFASYPDVDETAPYAGAVELLSALNIIKGDDLGNFNPDNTITRAEFAAIVCRAQGLEGNAVQGATAFVDVAADHWASGYINLATQNGIINGYGDGNFGPEDKVTYEQAVKMLVCALGFEPMAASKGGYPTGYLVVANQYKITAGVAATTEAPRKTVAQLVYNALSTPKMDQTSFGSDAKWEVLDGKGNREYATLLTDMDIYIATGVVGAKDADTIAFTVTEDSDDLEFKKDEKYCNKTFNINGSDIASYTHQNVDVYVEKDSRDYNVVAVVTNSTGETLVINSDDIKTVSANKVEYYTGSSSNTKTIKVIGDEKLTYEYNKVKEENKNLGDVIKDNNGTIQVKVGENFVDAEDVQLTFVENTGDTTYDSIIAIRYKSTRVDDVDEANSKITLDGTPVEIDYDNEDMTYVLTDDKGNALELKDFAEDDVVAYFGDDDNLRKAQKYIEIVKLSNASVTGTVTAISDKRNKHYIYIDGTEYEVAKDSAVTEFKNEDEGTFYIGMTGKVIDFEGSAAGENYAYILEGAKDKNFNNEIWQLKLLTKKDGVVTYDLTDNATEAFNAYTTEEKGIRLQGDSVKFDNISALDNTQLQARLITYKTNAKGEIKSFERATKATGTKASNKAEEEYNGRTQGIGKKILDDDAVIFDISGNDADNAVTSDVSSLVDDSKYEGFVFTDKNGDNVVFVVIDAEGQLSDEVGIAIVTGKRTSTLDGDEVVEIDYVQDGTEGTATFDDNTSEIKDTATEPQQYTKLNIGDIIMLNANADGLVSTYAVLGTINEKGLLKVNQTALNKFGDDNEFYYGYIANTKRDNSGKGERIELKYGAGADDTETLAITTDSNKYSYNDSRRDTVIEIGAFIDNDATYYDVADTTIDTDDEATFVFVRMIAGSVVDIYSFNERVVGVSNIAAVSGLYIECGKSAEASSLSAPVAKPVPVTDVVKDEEEVVENKEIDKVDLDD